MLYWASHILLYYKKDAENNMVFPLEKKKKNISYKNECTRQMSNACSSLILSSPQGRVGLKFHEKVLQRESARHLEEFKSKIGPAGVSGQLH